MTNLVKYLLFALSMSLVVLSCKQENKQVPVPEEDVKAKQMLEGIWTDADGGNVVFRVKGDSVFYPDSTFQPVTFKIIQDTMFLYGGNVSKYPIIRQTEYNFEFKNPSNDVVRLVKSEDVNDSLLFARQSTVTLNQGVTIKRDTIVKYNDNQYHCYVQVNPTTYKVYRSSYNSEGIEMENVYYDNIIHVSIFSGRTRLFSRDFRKGDYAGSVPQDMLKQCVLSDIDLKGLDDKGIKYQTQLAIPDSPTCFIVNMLVTYSGEVSMEVSKK